MKGSWCLCSKLQIPSDISVVNLLEIYSRNLKPAIRKWKHWLKWACTRNTLAVTQVHTQFLASFSCPNQVFQDPQRGRGTSDLQAPRQGRDGEEGDRAHGVWWAENHLCGFQRLPQQPRARLGQRERHLIWPDLHLCRWHWRPCKARGTCNFYLTENWTWMTGFLQVLSLFLISSVKEAENQL